MKNKKILIVLGGFLLVVAIIIGILLCRNVEIKAEYTNDYAKIFGEFTANTSSELLKENKENVCYSPVSLFAALSLAAEVTVGDTREELLECLGVESIEELEDKYCHLLDNIDNNGNSSNITLANSIWYLDNENASLGELVDLKDNFLCEIKPVAKISKEEVNGWISDKTNGMINEIVDSDDCSVLLSNALYYKSTWDKQFSNVSGKLPFTLENGKQIEVEFVESVPQNMAYVEKSKYLYINIKLKEGSLVLMIPKDGEELEDLTNEKIINELLALVSTDDIDTKSIKLKMPKFRISYEVESEILQEILNANGVEKIFENPEWINPIRGTDTRVRQENNFVLTSAGIEASAATTISAYLSAVKKEKEDLEMIVDKPFLYVLMKDDVPLFIGTVYNPAE